MVLYAITLYGVKGHYSKRWSWCDGWLLESALYRPKTGYYTDLIEMAAALFESLMNNHPFVDGNECVAFISADVFLRLNGYKMIVEPRAAHAFLMELFASNSCDLEHLAPWIRSVTKDYQLRPKFYKYRHSRESGNP